MSTIDELFAVFCSDDKQRRILEKEHGLKMKDEDFAFYKNQTSRRIGKSVNAVVPLTSSDRQFLRCSRLVQSHPERPTCSSATSTSESALGYLSESSSTNTDQSQSSATFEFIPESMPYENQNRKDWPNLARMCERFQISDRAAGANANSVMQDLGLITNLTLLTTNLTLLIVASFEESENDAVL